MSTELRQRRRFATTDLPGAPSGWKLLGGAAVLGTRGPRRRALRGWRQPAASAARPAVGWSRDRLGASRVPDAQRLRWHPHHRAAADVGRVPAGQGRPAQGGRPAPDLVGRLDRGSVGALRRGPDRAHALRRHRHPFATGAAGRRAPCVPHRDPAGPGAGRAGAGGRDRGGVVPLDPHDVRCGDRLHRGPDGAAGPCALRSLGRIVRARHRGVQPDDPRGGRGGLGGRARRSARARPDRRPAAPDDRAAVQRARPLVLRRPGAQRHRERLDQAQRARRPRHHRATAGWCSPR